jgi:hypothetical protein
MKETVIFALIRFGFWVICMQQASLCFSQNISFVNVQKFTEKQDLSSPNARKIISDKFGFIWVATEDGLNRFDGRQFLVFNKNIAINKQKCAGSDFKDIAEDTISSCIWALNSNNIVNKISIKTAEVISVYRLPQTEEEFYVNGLLTVSNILLVYTNKNFVFVKRRFDESGFYKITIADKSFEGLGIQKAALLNKDQILLCTSNGSIYSFNINNNTVKVLADIKFPAGNKFKFTGVCKSVSNIFFSTTEGLYKMYNGFTLKKIFEGRISALSVNQNEYFFSDSNKLYKGTNTNDIFTEIKIAGDPQNNSYLQNVIALYSYKNSLIISGGSCFLVANNTKSSFTKYFKATKKSIPDLEHVSYIDAVNDSILRFCSVNGIGDVNTNTSYINWYSNDQDYYRFISLNSEEAVFSGLTNSYIFSFKKKLRKPLPANLVFLKNDFIICSYTSSGKVIYFATYYGKKLYKVSYPYNSKSNVEILASPILTKDVLSVNNIIEDGNDIIFVCNKDIIKYNEVTKAITVTEVRKTPVTEKLEILMDLCKIKNNYFIAAYGYGLIKTDSNFKFISCLTDNNPIASLGFFKIFSIGDSAVLLSSTNGLLFYNLNTRQIKQFDVTDGLHDNNFDEFSGSRFGNIIFAGGINGITKINTDKLSQPEVIPKIYLKNFLFKYDATIKDSTNLTIRKIIVDNKVNAVELNFAVIDFENSGKVFYEYQIKEISGNWLSNGINNIIQLIGFKPGSYHIIVRAYNAKNIYSESISFQIIFKPKWYQTWWFKLLILLTTAAIIYAFYRYRIRQIKKQHEIRKNIATDLHDDLGSTLNSVKVFTNLAISGVKQQESLQQVKDNLTEATMSLRDMIWVLDDSLDTVDELITRLKQFAIPVAGTSNIEAIIKADIDVNNRQLIKEEKRNLFLICKEAINNSIKYAGATKIDVAITASGKKIQIAVADNGKGFNVDEVKKGYGLKNMQYRAGQIKYKVTLASSPGNGTQITILPS